MTNEHEVTVDKKLLFILYTLVSIIVYFVLNSIIITDKHYYNFLSSQLSSESINRFLIFRSKWVWAGYLIIPLLLIIKIEAVSFCILLGALFNEINLTYKKIFSIVLFAEGVNISAGIVKVIVLWNSDFLFFEDIIRYYPLSLTNLFDIDSIKPWSIYILQQLNLFQLIYLILLTIGFKEVTKIKFINSFLFIISTYGVALALWTTLLIFFAVTV